MMRFIRWQGLVSFTAIVFLIAVFVYVFADNIAKKAIEEVGGWYLGAEVNVENVDISYSPLVVNIENFQATDAQKPSHNLLSFVQASAGIDLWQYLFGKIHISELSIDKLTLNQQRKSPGAVYKTLNSSLSTSTPDKDKQGALPNLDVRLPKVDDLLKNNKLETVKQAQLLQESYQIEQQKLTELKAKLPSKSILAEYKQQVKLLTETKVKTLADVEQVTKEFNILKKKFKADKALVKQAKQQLKDSKVILSQHVKQLKAAPQQDWQHIEQEYQLDKIDAADFAHLLFGQQAREYFDYAELFYQKLLPMLNKGSAATATEQPSQQGGRFIYFTEQDPQPSVLIAKVHIALVLPQGDIIIDGKELTHQHWFRGQRSEINAVTTNLQGSGKASLSMNFSLDNQQSIDSKGQWQLNQLPLKNLTLQDSSALNLNLNSGMLAGEGTFSLVETNLNSMSQFNIAQTKFSGKADSKLSELFLGTVTSLESLALNVNASGALTEPKIAISSPLDKQLQASMQQQVSKKLTAFKSDVKAGLNEKLTAALGASAKEGQMLIDFDGVLNDTSGSLDKLLSADVTKQHKKQLKNKLKNKLGKLFG